MSFFTLKRGFSIRNKGSLPIKRSSNIGRHPVCICLYWLSDTLLLKIWYLKYNLVDSYISPAQALKWSWKIILWVLKSDWCYVRLSYGIYFFFMGKRGKVNLSMRLIKWEDTAAHCFLLVSSVSLSFPFILHSLCLPFFLPPKQNMDTKKRKEGKRNSARFIYMKSSKTEFGTRK